MLALQQLIRGGVRWRVGLGNRINVWSDPWLPDQMNSFVETSPIVELKHATVAFLKNIVGGVGIMIYWISFLTGKTRNLSYKFLHVTKQWRTVGNGHRIIKVNIS